MDCKLTQGILENGGNDEALDAQLALPDESSISVNLKIQRLKMHKMTVLDVCFCLKISVERTDKIDDGTIPKQRDNRQTLCRRRANAWWNPSRMMFYLVTFVLSPILPRKMVHRKQYECSIVISRNV